MHGQWDPARGLLFIGYLRLINTPKCICATDGMVPKDGAWSSRDGVTVDWLNEDACLVNADRYAPGPREMPCFQALEMQGGPTCEAVERCLVAVPGTDAGWGIDSL
jgi:hypothetical protein